MELFKPIKDFENYEVSTLGRIRNSKTGKFLKFYEIRGYKRVDLQNAEKKACKFLVHRLVLETFT
jgi:hypothetical protein